MGFKNLYSLLAWEMFKESGGNPLLARESINSELEIDREMV